MKLFRECYSGNTHFTSDGFPKQYRFYYDEKDTATCNCKIGGERRRITIDPAFWGDEEIPYKIGEKCNKCGVAYRHPKLWIYRCSACRPKEEK